MRVIGFSVCLVWFGFFFFSYIQVRWRLACFTVGTATKYVSLYIILCLCLCLCLCLGYYFDFFVYGVVFFCLFLK